MARRGSTSTLEAFFAHLVVYLPLVLNVSKSAVENSQSRRELRTLRQSTGQPRHWTAYLFEASLGCSLPSPDILIRMLQLVSRVYRWRLLVSRSSVTLCDTPTEVSVQPYFSFLNVG
jgi:hypothetical protein